jgi:calcineurin-like phosphoesterase family protein
MVKKMRQKLVSGHSVWQQSTGCPLNKEIDPTIDTFGLPPASLRDIPVLEYRVNSEHSRWFR